MEKTLADLDKDYYLELDKVLSDIKKKKAKKVLLQFPDGMKIYATAIVDELETKIKGVNFSIWQGSCFGACDVPRTSADLVIQFGHAKWR